MTTNNWNIDARHSGINFSIRHMVVSKVRGRFAKYTGAISLDESDLTRSAVEATIDASSIEPARRSATRTCDPPTSSTWRSFPSSGSGARASRSSTTTATA